MIRQTRIIRPMLLLVSWKTYLVTGRIKKAIDYEIASVTKISYTLFAWKGDINSCLRAFIQNSHRISKLIRDLFGSRH